MDNRKYSVEVAFEQIFSIPRLVGTFPLDCNYKISWSLLVFFIDLILNVLLSLHHFSAAEDKFNSYLILIRWSLLIPASMTNFACQYFKVERLIQYFKEVLAFEQYSHRIGVVWNYRYKWWNKYLSMFIALYTIIGWAFYSDLATVIIISIKRFHVYVILYSIVDQVTGTTSLLVSAMAHLKYIREDRELLRKFEQLIFLRRIIEDYFGPQILAITTWSFVSLFSLAFWYADSDMNAFQTACIFILAIFPFIKIYIPLLSIVSQAKKIDKLLYRRLLANPNDEMLEFHMIAKRDITFTAYGFFRINSSLIGSMITAATTYFVILLQYGS